MLTGMRSIWQHHKVLVTAFGLAAAITLFFSVRLVVDTLYWSDPTHRDQRIEGWMTPGYVAHSWEIPRPVMREALGLPPDTAAKARTLAEIAAEQGIPLPDLIAQITLTITQYRDAQ